MWKWLKSMRKMFTILTPSNSFCFARAQTISTSIERDGCKFIENENSQPLEMESVVLNKRFWVLSFEAQWTYCSGTEARSTTNTFIFYSCWCKSIAHLNKWFKAFASNCNNSKWRHEKHGRTCSKLFMTISIVCTVEMCAKFTVIHCCLKRLRYSGTPLLYFVLMVFLSILLRILSSKLDRYVWKITFSRFHFAFFPFFSLSHLYSFTSKNTRQLGNIC